MLNMTIKPDDAVPFDCPAPQKSGEAASDVFLMDQVPIKEVILAPSTNQPTCEYTGLQSLQDDSKQQACLNNTMSMADSSIKKFEPPEVTIKSKRGL